MSGRSKTSRTFAYIGLSPSQLKEHLQNQFQPGMTWKNYGNPNGDHTDCWHVDHIRPLASFKFNELDEEELESALHEAWHYSNLQPLWGLDNILKGDTWTHNHEPVEDYS